MLAPVQSVDAKNDCGRFVQHGEVKLDQMQTRGKNKAEEMQKKFTEICRVQSSDVINPVLFADEL